MCKGESLFHLGKYSIISLYLFFFRLIAQLLIFRSAYTASKHALQAWYDTARAELSDKNIKFTVVNPGYIKTSLSLNALTGNGQVYGSK